MHRKINIYCVFSPPHSPPITQTQNVLREAAYVAEFFYFLLMRRSHL